MKKLAMPDRLDVLTEVRLLLDKHHDLQISPEHLEWLATVPDSEAKQELAELRSMCRMTPFVFKD